MKWWTLYISSLLLLCASVAMGREVSVALYDVDRLYDTLPSPHYDDRAFTPAGRMQWSGERYMHKVEQIVKVIDSMSMDIVVLFGVESEQVVRDLQRTSRRDYSALHRSLDYYDGLDFALLYYGDILYINSVRVERYSMHVEGELLGRTISLHLTRRGDKFMSTLPHDSQQTADIVVAWGRFSPEDVERLALCDLLAEVDRAGRGDSYSSRLRGWYLRNRVGLGCVAGAGVECERAGVYISRYLLDGRGMQPLATYTSEGYVGGYSSHLPQYLILKVEE